MGFLGSEAEGDGRFVCTTTYYTYYSTTKVVDLASWAMLHLWAGAERTREFVAPLLHMQVQTHTAVVESVV